MKVYFSTSPRAKREYSKQIERIYNYLDKIGVQLTDETIRKVEVDEFYSWQEEKRKKYYDNTIKSIKQADICVFETSYPSLGVGHLINQALSNGKPVITMYTNGKKPFMLDSAEIDKITLLEYDNENLETVLSYALEYAKDNSDVRFNFFISPSIGSYLDWISRTKKVPRSVFLRGLIEDHMSADSDYLKT